MFTKLTTIILSSSLLFATTSTANAITTDFDTLPATEKQQIITNQDTYISYGIAVNKQEIKIIKHKEDKQELSENEKYTIKENKGNFKKGEMYKLIYKGDFIVKIERI